jgi:hypothetical protein
VAEIHRLYAHARDDVDALRRAASATAVPENWARWLREKADAAAAAPAQTRLS